MNNMMSTATALPDVLLPTCTPPSDEMTRYDVRLGTFTMSDNPGMSVGAAIADSVTELVDTSVSVP